MEGRGIRRKIVNSRGLAMVCGDGTEGIVVMIVGESAEEGWK